MRSYFIYSYVSCTYSYVICMSLVCTLTSSVCHSYVLVCQPYVTLCTCMSSLCHLYVVLPWTALQSMPIIFKVLSFLIGSSMITPRNLIELTLFSSILFKIKVGNFREFYLYPANCEKLDILLYFHLWKVFLLWTICLFLSLDLHLQF